MVAWIKDLGLTVYTEDAEDDGYRLLGILLQAKELVDVGDREVKRVTVGEMIEAMMAGKMAHKPIISSQFADIALRQSGIRVEPDRGKIFIANTSEWVRKQLQDTPFSDGWVRILRSIDGAGVVKTMRFHTSLSPSRATSLLLDKLPRASAEELK